MPGDTCHNIKHVSPDSLYRSMLKIYVLHIHTAINLYYLTGNIA